MRALLSRVTSVVRRRRLDSQLDAEVQFHIDMLAQEHMRRGLSAADARAAALRSFGGVTQMKESYREQRGLPFIEMFAQDARYGMRALLRAKGFTAAALLTLALGIGANSAIFSVVNAVLLRPLDYPDPERIVQMHRRSGGLWAGQTGRRYMFFRDQMKSFDALAAWRGTAFNAAAGDTVEYVPALAVSKEYFTVFGGAPVYGRVFSPDEDRENGPDAVILRYPIWQRMFGGDPSVVGRSISLGDRSVTVVGIMPRAFDSMRAAEVYVPLKPSTRGPGGGMNYTVAGRLRTGVSRDEANAESDSAFEAYKASLPNAKFEGEFSPVFISYQEGLSRSVKPALLMMLGAVGMLLLMACAHGRSKAEPHPTSRRARVPHPVPRRPVRPFRASSDPLADSIGDSIPIVQHRAGVSSNTFLAHRRSERTSRRSLRFLAPRRRAKNALRSQTRPQGTAHGRMPSGFPQGPFSGVRGPEKHPTGHVVPWLDPRGRVEPCCSVA